jgi:cyclopropane fatty-acyl-phospholipid synthase-like methyltransferase
MDKSSQAIAVFNKRANDYQSRYMDVASYHDTLDVFCDMLQPDARVLELACGPGNMTRYMLDKRPDLKIFGSDLAPNMISLAKTNNPEADFSVADMREINQISEKFNGLICGFGLPYLPKEEALAFIAHLPKVLFSNALVYLSTMEGDYKTSRIQKSSDGLDEIFIHFHEAGYLTAALETAGFEILLKKSQEFPGNNDTDLILIAKWSLKL